MEHNMEYKEQLSISDKIEIMKLACQNNTSEYKERYETMLSLILENKPTSNKPITQ